MGKVMVKKNETKTNQTMQNPGFSLSDQHKTHFLVTMNLNL